uniref:Uncharacterized protein n=1 Tax=Bionectria ochroleuca TaxID=29856 RepID=A0A0B7KBH3_BIOOC
MQAPRLSILMAWFAFASALRTCVPLGEPCVAAVDCCDDKACVGPKGNRVCHEWVYRAVREDEE